MATRREFLMIGGALAISFTLPLVGPARALERASSKSQESGHVGAWLAIDRDGGVTLYVGKVELGTGVQTALAQLVAEELDMPVTDVTVIMGDTALSVDQGPTLGSLSMKASAVPVRRAAATARARIVDHAAVVFGVAVAELTTRAGRVFVTAQPARTAFYRDLVPATWTALPVDETLPLKPPGAFEVIGKPVPRLELPAKVAGTHPYLQNLRLPGMVHARVIHPPIKGASLVRVSRESVASMPGFIDLIVKQNFVAVVCEEEFQAVAATRSLDIEWKVSDQAIDGASVYDAMHSETGDLDELRKSGDADEVFAKAAKRIDVVFRTPYQTHGSIGPSCGVADVGPERATVWSATQGSFPLRDALANILGIPEDKVRVIWAEGAGCYGHNGADDASAEAAIISQTLRLPVRVQWMRHDEHGWDPKCPAMEIHVKASVGEDGMVQSWAYVVSTPTHISRPLGSAGNLLPGRLIGLPPKHVRIGGDHCARSLYRFADERVMVRAGSANSDSSLSGFPA